MVPVSGTSLRYDRNPISNENWSNLEFVQVLVIYISVKYSFPILLFLLYVSVTNRNLIIVITFKITFSGQRFKLFSKYFSLSHKQLIEVTKSNNGVSGNSVAPTSDESICKIYGNQANEKYRGCTSRPRKRKSRWADNDELSPAFSDVKIPSPTTIIPSPPPSSAASQNASQDFDGLSEEEFKKHIFASQIAAKALAKMVKPGPSNEYDSDEDTEGGTFEHKQRLLEMQRTQRKANLLTEKAEGKHHLADFLPENENLKFADALAKAKKLAADAKSGSSLSNGTKEDYVENKLESDNKGFKLLQKMGWSGKGLGAKEQGIQAPVNKGKAPSDMQGLGAESSESDGSIFDVYRQRMMLAYKFRPNPLNNPRRPYY